MEWWGPARTLQTKEDADELVFVSTRLKRKGDALIVSAIALAGLAAVLLWQSFITLFICVSFSGIYLYSVFYSSPKALRVTERQLKGARQAVAWKDVFELRFEGGGEDSPTGLFARTSRWSSTCILQNVSKVECDAIIYTIYRKWPNLSMAERPEKLWASIVKTFRGIP